MNYFELNIELLKQSVHTALSEIELLREGKHSVLAEIELFEFDRRRREMEIELFGDGTTFAERLKEAMQASGMKQVDLVNAAAAHGVKLGKSYVSQYVTGKTGRRA